MDKEAFVFDKFVKRIRGRMLFNNQNWLAIICGGTGTGKSYSALSFAEQVGNKVFVVFNSLSFMQLLNNKGVLSKGDIIIFDEAGVGMSSRDWYSQQNKLLGAVLQTFRNMNVGVIFTTPDLSFIDLQARKLFHNYFETVHLDRDRELATLKVYDIQPNSRIGKEYYKHPLFKVESGGQLKMTHILISKPGKKLTDKYEADKTAYTEALNKRVLEELMPKTPKGKAMEIGEVIVKVSKDKDKYMREYKGRKYLDVNLIRNDFNLSIRNSKIVKSSIEVD